MNLFANFNRLLGTFLAASFALCLSGCEPSKLEKLGQEAKLAAARDLLDPNSAQFRNVKGDIAPLGGLVCGEINGKNSMGAYVGFKKFLYNSISGVRFQPPKPDVKKSTDALIVYSMNPKSRQAKARHDLAEMEFKDELYAYSNFIAECAKVKEDIGE